MKTFLLCLGLLTAACSSTKEDPTPAPVVTTSPVTYTDASGASGPVSVYSALLTTATPGSNGARSAVLTRATLPNGSNLDVTYTFYGSGLPGAGAVTLNEGPIVDNYKPSDPAFPRTRYQAVGTGTLTVDAVSPRTISSTYTGPLVAGGPAVRLAFARVTF